jgi:hypothetical protein
MSTPTRTRATAGADVDVDRLVDLVGTDLVEEMATALVADIDRYLVARRRTAHPLVTATTEELVRTALANLPTAPAAGPATPVLPRGLWRVLPDRLLALHPARRGEGVTRLRISVAEHLELTALVLEHWGWSKTGRHIRTGAGRRCILGAQYAVFRLGYGTEDTAVAASAHLQAVLARRGIRQPFPQWNDSPDVTREQVLAVVRDAAAAARC